jgi:hypothetical protein
MLPYNHKIDEHLISNAILNSPPRPLLTAKMKKTTIYDIGQSTESESSQWGEDRTILLEFIKTTYYEITIYFQFFILFSS